MSQQYFLPCACGQKLRVAPAQAGGQVSCGCGRSQTVPTLRGLKVLEPAPDKEQAATEPGWSTIHGVIFAISLMMAAAGLGAIGYHLWLYSAVMQHSEDRTAEWAELEAAPVDKLTPVEALQFWHESIAAGIHVENTPTWVAARQAAARYLFWIKVGGCLLAGGLLPAIATLYIGRGRKR